MNHEIFNSPNKVALTIENKPTPGEYTHHPKAKNLGKTIPMWRVQTEGYKDGKGQLVGVVSRDAGFFDSPDVEWISSGVNTKGPEAVAIGRHGNFLHWGFAASPKYMTEEAKLVLVNALHYIAKFDGQTPVARKVSGTVLRESVLSNLESITEEGYAKTLARYAGYRKDDEDRKAAIQAKIDAGEKVTDMDKQSLTYPPVEDPGRFDRVRGFFSDEAWKSVEGDPQAIGDYLRSNLPFMHPTGGWYELGVDEELKSFGKGSADPDFLATAIAALQDPEQAALAQTLLTRYTNQNFGNASEWKAWHTKVQDKLFFCETAGYKWLVNSLESAANAPAIFELKPNAKTPVAMALTAAAEGKNHRLTVHVKILKGWHAYDSVPDSSAYRPLVLSLTLPDGVQQVGEWKRPASHPDKVEPQVMVLEGEVSFECLVTGVKAATEIGCKVSYQVCDARMCLPPSSKALKAVLQP
ncbi:MAG: hypothetical protein GY930_10235 [bacterium]|nr:hypothetical protein [bacterium]